MVSLLVRALNPPRAAVTLISVVETGRKVPGDLQAGLDCSCLLPLQEYYDYIFPDESNAANTSLKLLDAAAAWARKMQKV